jgi:hypothetical protein
MLERPAPSVKRNAQGEGFNPPKLYPCYPASHPANKTSTALLWISAALGEGMRLYNFRETDWFTRHVLKYLGDESYAQLQLYLLHHPEAGDLIQAGGGIRKVRWTAVGKGKRGGTRVIYYLALARGTFFMLDIYAKSEKEDLTADELKVLRKLVEEWLL